jgi:hypothetical protein
MFVALPGFLGSAGGGFPPPGTLLSSHCSGYSAQDAGNEDYTDANGTIWNGMFTTWQQLADGMGGSYWQSLGSNSSDEFSSCWYPNGFCISNDSGVNYVNWEGCGSSGSFGPTSYYYNIVFADGAGGTYNDSGGGQYDPPSSGAVIYQSGAENCCTVYYDGNNGYYITDTCSSFPPYGTLLSSHCSGYTAQDAGNQDYTDADGRIWNGMFTLWQELADGNGGSFWSSAGNNTSDAYSSCWLPAGYASTFAPSYPENSTSIDDDGTYIYLIIYQGNRQNGSGGTSYEVINPVPGTTISTYYTLFPTPQNFYIGGTYGCYNADGSGGYYFNAL